jgi:hypothetical protein
MPFLDVLKGVPGAAIGVRIFKKEFQVCPGNGRVVFDDDNHLASRTLDEATKLVIALGRIRRQHAPLAQYLCQPGFEGTDFVALLANGTLLQVAPTESWIGA